MRRALQLLLLASVLGLAACGGDDDGGDTRTVTVTPEPSATEEASATASASPAATEATDAPAEDAAPVAEQTVQARGAGTEATVDVAIAGLQVSGELATLSVTLTPHYPDATTEDAISLYDMHGGDAPEVTLVDPVNLKRYLVVQDADDKPLETYSVTAETVNDKPLDAQYTFAAPPQDVTEIDVAFGDWPPFRGVPVTR